MKKHNLLPYIYVYKDLIDDVESVVNFIKKTEQDNCLCTLNQWEDFSMNDESDPKGRSTTLKLNSPTCSDEELYFLNSITSARMNAINDYIENSGVKELMSLDFKNVTLSDSSTEFNVFDIIKNNKEESSVVHTDNMNNYNLHFHIDESESGMQHAIVAMIYLNDDFIGGEIEFYNEGKIFSYKPVAGDIVLFPATYPFYHGTKKNIGGDRYAIRASYDLVSEKIFKFISFADHIKSDTPYQLDIFKQENIINLG